MFKHAHRDAQKFPKIIRFTSFARPQLLRQSAILHVCGRCYWKMYIPSAASDHTPTTATTTLNQSLVTATASTAASASASVSATTPQPSGPSGEEEAILIGVRGSSVARYFMELEWPEETHIFFESVGEPKTLLMQ